MEHPVVVLRRAGMAQQHLRRTIHAWVDDHDLGVVRRARIDEPVHRRIAPEAPVRLGKTFLPRADQERGEKRIVDHRPQLDDLLRDVAKGRQLHRRDKLGLRRLLLRREHSARHQAEQDHGFLHDLLHATPPHFNHFTIQPFTHFAYSTQRSSRTTVTRIMPGNFSCAEMSRQISPASSAAAESPTTDGSTTTRRSRPACTA